MYYNISINFPIRRLIARFILRPPFQHWSIMSAYIHPYLSEQLSRAIIAVVTFAATAFLLGTIVLFGAWSSDPIPRIITGGVIALDLLAMIFFVIRVILIQRKINTYRRTMVVLGGLFNDQYVGSRISRGNGNEDTEVEEE